MPSEPSDRDFWHIWLPFDDTPGGATCISVDMRKWNAAWEGLESVTRRSNRTRYEDGSDA